VTEGRKYRKPPVIEALCELYFAGSEWDDTIPGRFFESPTVKRDFPVKRQREIQEAQITFAEGQAAAGVRRLSPWIQFVSEKGDRMIQLARDLLVVNQLRPYPRFEDWELLIYRSVDLYTELAKPVGVARLGLRYINRVAIPQPMVRMEDYFTVYPHLPTAMGDMHGGFMIRVELPSQKGSHGVLVTFGSAPPDKPGEIAHLLDLYDIFKPAQPFAFEHVQQEVRAAHDNVEKAFEGSITERLRAMFEPEDE
jgi:uncharacterized protein (TIGR04255 family)